MLLKDQRGRTDSLFCGKAAAGQTVHRAVCLERPFESALQMSKRTKRSIRMLDVRRMNSIRSRAAEIVNKELIFV